MTIIFYEVMNMFLNIFRPRSIYCITNEEHFLSGARYPECCVFHVVMHCLMTAMQCFRSEWLSVRSEKKACF